MRFRYYVTAGVLALATLAAASLMAVFTLNLAEAAVPPFDPTGNGATQGTLSLYNASGNQVTSGSLSAPPAFALATTDKGRSGDNLATLYAATPQQGVNPLLWPNDIISAAAGYPNSGAPGSLKNNPKALATNLFTWLDPTDPDSYATAFPNVNTTASWQNLYQLRLFTSGPGQARDPQRYSSATIQINTGAGTWTQVYPDTAASAPVVTSRAKITGTKMVGSRVTCKVTFSGATSISYKWFRGSKTISGATSKKYKLVSADANKKVKCRATGTNANGSTPSTSKAVTIKPAAALAATKNPTISGLRRVE